MRPLFPRGRTSARPAASRTLLAATVFCGASARSGYQHPDARRVLPAPLLVEERCVARVTDLPRAADLHVLVGVVGRDPHVPLLVRVEEVVVEPPAPARGRRPGELDLGMTPVVDGERPGLVSERRAEEA